MTEPSSIGPLVSSDWLAGRLREPKIRIIDASWYLPQTGRDARAEYAAAHLPGAVFFDLDATSDQSTPLPHMLPDPDTFAERVSQLGIDSESTVVVYDGSGVNLSAPRAWWTFQVFGHERVAVLDGGLGKWRGEGRPLDAGAVFRPRGRFTARLNPALVRDLAAMKQNHTQQSEQVVDLRSAGRFAGTEPEPRPGLRGGHLPGSLNLPFTELVNPDGTVLPPARLRERMERAGIDLSRPVVASCGSGTTACALILSLHLLDHTANAVYDGSWSEWGGREDLPLERGRD